MTALSHLDPNFGSVVALEAVNEPIMDATQTPGYGDCTTFLAVVFIPSYINFASLALSPEGFCGGCAPC